MFIYLVVKFERPAGGRRGLSGPRRSTPAASIASRESPSGSSDGATLRGRAHPYSADLDLFGPGSLFERMTACRTRVGEETLAAWLGGPATPEVKARQEAVADLAPRSTCANRSQSPGRTCPAADYTPLAEWGFGSPRTGCRGRGESRSLEDAGRVEILGWGNVPRVVGWLFVGTTSLPVLAFGVAVAHSRGAAVAVDTASARARTHERRSLASRSACSLDSNGNVFTRRGSSELQAAMIAGRALRRLRFANCASLLEWYNSPRNPLFIPVAILRMWDIRFAFKLEAWRARSGLRSGTGCGPSARSKLSPRSRVTLTRTRRDVFPTGRSMAPTCESSPLGVGHPLIPHDKCVRNDVSLGGDGGPRVLLISGSNMSGKSTLLRAVGVNAVLALAGGVVRRIDSRSRRSRSVRRCACRIRCRPGGRDSSRR